VDESSVPDTVSFRFNGYARAAISRAYAEAKGLQHDFVGTEHLFLGLLPDDGLAGQVLRTMDIDVGQVRDLVATRVGRSEEPRQEAPLTFSPGAKQALELAYRESRKFGSLQIMTEGMLLALAQETEGVAVRVLLDRGVDAWALRNRARRGR
jgi:ATP-dependent Clp protease ATP-binding subunit ClpC